MTNIGIELGTKDGRLMKENCSHLPTLLSTKSNFLFDVTYIPLSHLKDGHQSEYKLMG